MSNKKRFSSDPKMVRRRKETFLALLAGSLMIPVVSSCSTKSTENKVSEYLDDEVRNTITMNYSQFVDDYGNVLELSDALGEICDSGEILGVETGLSEEDVLTVYVGGFAETEKTAQKYGKNLGISRDDFFHSSYLVLEPEGDFTKDVNQSYIDAVSEELLDDNYKKGDDNANLESFIEEKDEIIGSLPIRSQKQMLVNAVDENKENSQEVDLRRSDSEKAANIVDDSFNNAELNYMLESEDSLGEDTFTHTK